MVGYTVRTDKMTPAEVSKMRRKYKELGNGNGWHRIGGVEETFSFATEGAREAFKKWLEEEQEK